MIKLAHRLKPRRSNRPLFPAMRRVWAYLVRRQAAIDAKRDPYGPLTVGQLVLQLQRFNPDTRVIMPGELSDWSDVYEAHLDTFAVMPEWGLGLADDGDEGALLAVRLFGSPDDD